MRNESLNALLIDRELGELTPEAVELLESWLVAHPDRGGEVVKVRNTLSVTREAVLRTPQLVEPNANVITIPRTEWHRGPLAVAASVALLLGISGWAGFRVGRHSQEVSTTQKEKPNAPAAGPAGPWAQYALVSNPQGGLTVVQR